MSSILYNDYKPNHIRNPYAETVTNCNISFFFNQALRQEVGGKLKTLRIEGADARKIRQGKKHPPTL